MVAIRKRPHASAFAYASANCDSIYVHTHVCCCSRGAQFFLSLRTLQLTLITLCALHPALPHFDAAPLPSSRGPLPGG